MNGEMIVSIVLAIVSMVNGWGWVTNRRKYKVEVKNLEAQIKDLEASINQKNMDLAKEYVIDWETYIAEPLRKDVRDLRDKIQKITEELENVKKCSCYRADCPNRISMLDKQGGKREG